MPCSILNASVLCEIAVPKRSGHWQRKSKEVLLRMCMASLHRASMNSVLRRMVHIFCFIALVLVSPYSVDAYAQATAPSGYSLVGTIQSRDFSGATIIVDKNEQAFFRLFDKLPDGSQLVKVLTDSIVLKREDGLNYELFISHSPVKLTTAQKLYNKPGDPFAGGRRQSADVPRINKYRARYNERHHGNDDDE
jgi:hypothetical protein